MKVPINAEKYIFHQCRLRYCPQCRHLYSPMINEIKHFIAIFKYVSYQTKIIIIIFEPRFKYVQFNNSTFYSDKMLKDFFINFVSLRVYN